LPNHRRWIWHCPRPPIRADLTAIAKQAKAIRNLRFDQKAWRRVSGGFAAEFGLAVTLGIWIDKDEAPKRA